MKIFIGRQNLIEAIQWQISRLETAKAEKLAEIQRKRDNYGKLPFWKALFKSCPTLEDLTWNENWYNNKLLEINDALLLLNNTSQSKIELDSQENLAIIFNLYLKDVNS